MDVQSAYLQMTTNPLSIFSVCFSVFGLVSDLNTPSKHSIHVTDIIVDCCNILVVTVSSASAVFGAPRRARKTIVVQNLLTYVSENLANVPFFRSVSQPVLPG